MQRSCNRLFCLNAVDSASKAIAAGNWDHQQFLSMDADGKATVV